jgi:hypothetical protein
MTDNEHLRLTLEVHGRHEPICGRILGGRHGDERFHGWVELVAALERARGVPETPSSANTAHLQSAGFPDTPTRVSSKHH